MIGNHEMKLSFVWTANAGFQVALQGTIELFLHNWCQDALYPFIGYENAGNPIYPEEMTSMSLLLVEVCIYVSWLLPVSLEMFVRLCH